MASWVLSGFLLLTVLLWDGYCVPLTKGQNPSGNYGSGHTGGQAYPGSGNAGGSHGAAGQPGGGHASGGFASGGLPAGGHPSGGFASGGLPAGGHPSGGFASGGLPAGGVPAGGFAAGGFASAGFPAEGLSPGGLAGTGANLGGLASGGFSAGAAPTGTHPGGQLPSYGGFGVGGAQPAPAPGSPAAAAGLAFYGAASPGVLSSSQPELSWTVEPSTMDADITAHPGGAGIIPNPGLVADFVPGEMAHYERAFEHGHRDTETQDQGYLAQGAGGAVAGQGADLGLVPYNPRMYPVPGINFGQYPYDYQFLTGNYPPGTVTHYSDTFEQGRDKFDEGHYIDYHIPVAQPADQKVVKPPPQQQTYQQPFKKAFPQRYG